MALLSKFHEPIWFARRFGCPMPSKTNCNGRNFSFDVATLRLLIEMYERLHGDHLHGDMASDAICDVESEESESEGPNANSLNSPMLHFRSQLRSCRHAKCGRAMLKYIIGNTTDEKMLVLAIWLRGWYRGTSGTREVTDVLPLLEARERRVAVRTLRRLSAWPQLKNLATHDLDERVRRLATVAPPAKHKKRLSKFLNLLEEREITDSPQADLYVADHVDFSWSRPAKPPWFIRVILERIRFSLTGLR